MLTVKREGYTGKIYRIIAIIGSAKISKRDTDKDVKVCVDDESLCVLKRIVGVMLIALAVVFGKLITLVCAPVAFIVVFLYIMLQIKLWSF